MREFLQDHRALLVKHARRYVQSNAEKIPVEDVAREMELVTAQLEKDRGVIPARVVAPDAFFRSIVKHAAGRAKRRRKLVEQVAAGDDLDAFSQDLKALDRDLPDPLVEPDADARKARATLDAIKKKLAARDSLVFALLIEDDSSVDEVARILSMPLGDVESALGRALVAAEELGVEVPPATASQPRGAT